MQIDGNSLDLLSFEKIVSEKATISLSPSTKERIDRSRAHVEALLKSKNTVYAINTGFGVLSDVKIDADKLVKLQENIIRSHCSSVGKIHSSEESRAILLLRLNTLAKGFSGVRLALVEHLVNMLNQGVHPVIPEQGSVGASGDLSPLAHVAAVVIGEGEALWKGERISGAKALKAAGLTPYAVAEKEGLSLINGTQQMTALGGMLLLKAKRLANLADLIMSCTLDGSMGSAAPLTSWIHDTRPFSGQKASARIIRNCMENSEILQSHKDCDRVQDAYSIRCTPQVHGAARNLLEQVQQTIEIEFNAATDNPLVNPDTGEILSNGNFHGQPVAFALDILGMAIAELASISERRLAKLFSPQFSGGLPSFLVKEEGLNSGFMAAGYTAASMVSENKIFTHSASNDSIPTCNEKEDHVSMGPNAARKAAFILNNTETVLAIEMLAACQALEFRRPMRPGVGPKIVLDFVRKEIPPLEQDRYLHYDIDAVTRFIREGKLYEQASQAGLFEGVDDE